MNVRGEIDHGGMFNVIGFIFEVAFRALGLWVLKVMTFGHYRDTNSYLYFLPNFVGCVFFLVVLFVVALCLSD
ncbi:hypothetical protein SAMN05216381_0588 [Pseudomonas seleniipraecipitans]|uniref:Uncharacterized protein n=1 Tax=Phytopseudomonas seleniipraecipitans TaxID=640205 RepID=A0A1G7HCE5_9GAMM|nr:hypothetical protein SAMN05216381_0588 [Pseudomonas seleniipraecipitans]